MIASDRHPAWMILAHLGREIALVYENRYGFDVHGPRIDLDGLCLRTLQALETAAPHVVAKYVLDRHSASRARAVEQLSTEGADEDLPF